MVLQPACSLLPEPAGHRLKPMLQAEARATSTSGTDLLNVFPTQNTRAQRRFYQRVSSRIALARRLLTTASTLFDIFSSQRLLESGEILRMWSVLMIVLR